MRGGARENGKIGMGAHVLEVVVLFGFSFVRHFSREEGGGEKKLASDFFPSHVVSVPTSS